MELIEVVTATAAAGGLVVSLANRYKPRTPTTEPWQLARGNKGQEYVLTNRTGSRARDVRFDAGDTPRRAGPWDVVEPFQSVYLLVMNSGQSGHDVTIRWKDRRGRERSWPMPIP